LRLSGSKGLIFFTFPPTRGHEEECVVWSGGVDPDDLAQGRLGNCYFLAFIAACALEDQDALLMDLFVEEHADVGMFGITFFVNGKLVTVVIDDRIPCVRQGREWIPIFAGPKAHSGQKSGEKELWPMLFEKAWAKLHLSYEATAGGLAEDATSYLTGGIITNVVLEGGNDNSDAWNVCYKALNPEDGNAFAFLSCAVRSEEDASHVGLITGHAYSVLKLHQAQGKRFVQVRNPWGECEWSGDYSDNMPFLTPFTTRTCRVFDTFMPGYSPKP